MRSVSFLNVARSLVIHSSVRLFDGSVFHFKETGNKTDPSIDTVLDTPLVSWKSKFIENVVS
jgi:hypothetical protein